MAARSPRRSFAAPFVVTLAAVPACYVEPASPQPPRQPVVTAQPAPPQPAPPPPAPPAQPEPAAGEVTVVNPPRPTPATGGTAPTPASPGPTTTTYPFDQRWTVTKAGAGCLAYAKVECPKPAKKGAPMPTCNPPPPMAITCPPGVTDRAGVTVVQYANQSTCQVEPAPMTCPPNVMCNPPPPQPVACPTRR